MATRKSEVFDSIKLKNFVYEDAQTGFPSQNSIMVAIDNEGTTGFTTNINCNTVTTGTLTAATGNFSTITANTGTFTNLNATTLTVTSANITGGTISATAIALPDPVNPSNKCTLDVSGSSLRCSFPNSITDVLGWKTKLAQNTAIALLPANATLTDISGALNTLLSVFKTQGVFIT